MDAKKLMILGGSRYILPVIKTAHELGLYVITCDYLPHNVAHQYSDYYCNVSIIDKETVLKKCEELRIDGIISFACDPGVVTAAYVAEKMNLPFQGSYEAVSLLQNKRRFREYLKHHGFAVPNAKGYRDIEQALKEYKMFRWPIIVKPTDSAGSKGVRRVDNYEELEAAINNALIFSHENEFIIEEYIETFGYPSDSDVFLVDGELEYISFSSQLFDSSAKNPFVPAAFSWPSQMEQPTQKHFVLELQRLFNLLELKTGIFNIEVRKGIDGKAYIMECSPRGGGNRIAECLKYATGVELIENTVRAAVNFDLLGFEKKMHDDYWLEVILHSVEEGLYDGLWIDRSIQEYLVEEDVWVQKGDMIKSFLGANNTIGTLIFCFDDLEKMNELQKNINKFIKVMLKTVD